MFSTYTKTTALLEIDVQNDFCPAYTTSAGGLNPAGALAVASGDTVIPPLNTLAATVAAAGGLVAATQDWHPAGHISFASGHTGKKAGDIVATDAVGEQVLWPDHCVQGTWGAQFHEKLDTNPISMIIRKGWRPELDSYSAFFENDRQTSTGLDQWLKGLGINQIIIGGLATDYCVFYSVMDALAMHYFTVVVVSDAVRGVDYPAGSTDRALAAMKESGAIFMNSAEIISEIVRYALPIPEPLR
jgi:nicotinamidase/pyrazinamidase